MLTAALVAVSLASGRAEALADELPTPSAAGTIYFGNGCFWGRQHDFVEVRRRCLLLLRLLLSAAPAAPQWPACWGGGPPAALPRGGSTAAGQAPPAPLPSSPGNPGHPLPRCPCRTIRAG
jgi:hypothetical protein